MKLLLDTHIWLWSLKETHLLGPGVLQEIRDSKNELWLSPISTWEAVTLHDKKRIFLDRDVERWIAASTAPFREAALTHEVVAVARRLALPQRDLADRFLVATASVLGLTLVTADAQLLGLGEISTLANR